MSKALGLSVRSKRVSFYQSQEEQPTKKYNSIDKESLFDKDPKENSSLINDQSQGQVLLLPSPIVS